MMCVLKRIVYIYWADTLEKVGKHARASSNEVVCGCPE